jgi:hypothetical protein
MLAALALMLRIYSYIQYKQNGCSNLLIHHKYAVKCGHKRICVLFPASLRKACDLKSCQVFAVENGEARSLWEQLAGHVKVLVSEQLGHADWTIFEGVIADSLEAKEAISSLMQEPFRSVPLIWIVHEDILANRLPVYQRMGQNSLISHWRSAFARADVVVFPQFTLPVDSCPQ